MREATATERTRPALRNATIAALPMVRQGADRELSDRELAEIIGAGAVLGALNGTASSLAGPSHEMARGLLALATDRHTDAEVALLTTVALLFDNARLLLAEFLRDTGRDAAVSANPAPAVASPASAPEGVCIPWTGETLSPREAEVLRHLASGATNAQIATLLFVSPNTVKTHVARILAKLAVASRTQAAARSRDLGLT